MTTIPVVESFTDASGTSTPAVPSGVAADDIVVLFVYSESGPEGVAQTINGPTGFAHAPNSPVIVGGPSGSNGQYHSILWKRATGADTGTYTITAGSETNSVVSCAIRVSGCETSGNPWDVTDSAVDNNTLGTSSGPTPAVSLTTTGDNELLVWSSTDWNFSDCGLVTGMTEHIHAGAVGCQTEGFATAGSTGSISATRTEAPQQQTAWIGALIPAGGGGGGATPSGSMFFS